MICYDKISYGHINFRVMWVLYRMIISHLYDLHCISNKNSNYMFITLISSNLLNSPPYQTEITKYKYFTLPI